MFNRRPTPIQAFHRRRFLFLMMAVIAVAGAGGSYYFYQKYQAVKSNPTEATQKEVTKLVSTVGKLMELPTGETPTIATISDKSKLKDQPFFKTAVNGDKLFVYNAAMLAILYRPSTNKIINVAPITINQPTAASAVTAPVRVAYYNGTSTVGVSAAAEKIVKEKYPTWETATMTTAKKNDYTKTLVVNLTGQTQAASDLADLLHGSVGTLPAGETRPSADLLVISGQ